jgi:hypothetical protein
VGRRAGAEGKRQSHQHHQHRILGHPTLIMTIGLLPDALKPGIHCVRTHWIRGFMAFRLAGA